MNEDDNLVRAAGMAALASGGLGLAALVSVLVGEATRGTDAFMGSATAELTGWATFVAAALLAVALLGVAVRYAGELASAGRTALLVLGFATAVTAGAMGTFALVVPALAERAPDLVSDPPAAVPATFIISGLVSGVCALVLAVGLRRAEAAPRAVTTLLIVGAVVSMVPLPSRFFLLALAVGVLLLSGRSVSRPVAAPAPDRPRRSPAPGRG